MAIQLSSPDRYEGRSRLDRKQLGIFYTPDRLALALTRWAVRGNVGAVLDPSFGGCSFLRAGVVALAENGVSRPEQSVYGIDIDELGGRRAASELQRCGVPLCNFR